MPYRLSRLGDFSLSASLIAFIQCPRSKNSSCYTARVENWQNCECWGSTLNTVTQREYRARQGTWCQSCHSSLNIFYYFCPSIICPSLCVSANRTSIKGPSSPWHHRVSLPQAPALHHLPHWHHSTTCSSSSSSCSSSSSTRRWQSHRWGTGWQWCGGCVNHSRLDWKHNMT